MHSRIKRLKMRVHFASFYFKRFYKSYWKLQKKKNKLKYVSNLQVT